ncbi:tryptophan synthase beta chain [Striga asiatica]|uniref:Tryptophan synthase beta chain n=1 Tax=Striga asiatica TaxID=4170 RepID=A0A5A7QY80_STRAF|nr:tryptophan synthase beta chain [Striga asiatica]
MSILISIEIAKISKIHIYIYLIFHRCDSTTFSPVEIGRQIIGRQNRRLISVGREAEPPVEAKELAAEFARRQIGESRDAVDGGGVELLVPPRAAQVSLEDPEPAVVLLLRGVRLSEFPLEDREVVVGVQQRVLVNGPQILAVIHHLPNQKIAAVGGASDRVGVCIGVGVGKRRRDEEGEKEDFEQKPKASMSGGRWLINQWDVNTYGKGRLKLDLQLLVKTS